MKLMNREGESYYKDRHPFSIGLVPSQVLLCSIQRKTWVPQMNNKQCFFVVCFTSTEAIYVILGTGNRIFLKIIIVAVFRR